MALSVRSAVLSSGLRASVTRTARAQQPRRALLVRASTEEPSTTPSEGTFFYKGKAYTAAEVSLWCNRYGAVYGACCVVGWPVSVVVPAAAGRCIVAMEKRPFTTPGAPFH